MSTASSPKASFTLNGPDATSIATSLMNTVDFLTSSPAPIHKLNSTNTTLNYKYTKPDQQSKTEKSMNSR